MEKEVTAVEFNAGKSSSCQCTYRILSIELDNPDGYPNHDICFWSSADCDPFNPSQCTYFKGLYNSFFPECVTILFENCAEVWPSIPPDPYELFSFNCNMEKFSSIPIAFGGVPLSPQNCVEYSFYNNATITFAIYCQEEKPDCGGYGWSTGPVTLSFSNVSGQQNIEALATLALQGKCGCTPIVFK